MNFEFGAKEDSSLHVARNERLVILSSHITAAAMATKVAPLRQQKAKASCGGVDNNSREETADLACLVGRVVDLDAEGIFLLAVGCL
eukprot:g8675.t1